MARTPVAPLDRFNAMHMPEPNSGCWLWMGSLNDKGYGWFGWESDVIKAHRAAWMLFRGAIPAAMKVLHKCDVRCCVNPDHLFLGSNAVNSRDMVFKGRSARGEKHQAAKLTAADVLYIRESADAATALAARFGVDRETIYDVRKRKSWRHI